MRSTSSPPQIIGMPWLTSSVENRLRSCRWRRLLTSLMVVGPSTPQFHERLLLSPSRLSSPLAMLCLLLYVTRSFMVKPSCAVMKFTEATGLRPLT